jgi:hypothetical protein
MRSLLGLGLGASALVACGTDGGTGEPDPLGDDDPMPDANMGTPVDAGTNSADAATQTPIDAAPIDAAPPATCSAATVAINSNHGHSMQVAPADLSSTSSKMYSIQGSASHPHTVTITPAQFATLRMNGTLTVMSSTNSGHPHSITVSCA